jgi:predicted transcriptional regulator with HTH domain
MKTKQDLYASLDYVIQVIQSILDTSKTSISTGTLDTIPSVKLNVENALRDLESTKMNLQGCLMGLEMVRYGEENDGELGLVDEEKLKVWKENVAMGVYDVARVSTFFFFGLFGSYSFDLY